MQYPQAVKDAIFRSQLARGLNRDLKLNGQISADCPVINKADLDALVKKERKIRVDRINALAEARDRAISEFVREALREALEGIETMSDYQLAEALGARGYGIHSFIDARDEHGIESIVIYHKSAEGKMEHVEGMKLRVVPA